MDTAAIMYLIFPHLLHNNIFNPMMTMVGGGRAWVTTERMIDSVQVAWPVESVYDGAASVSRSVAGVTRAGAVADMGDQGLEPGSAGTREEWAGDWSRISPLLSFTRASHQPSSQSREQCVVDNIVKSPSAEGMFSLLMWYLSLAKSSVIITKLTHFSSTSSSSVLESCHQQHCETRITHPILPGE